MNKETSEKKKREGNKEREKFFLKGKKAKDKREREIMWLYSGVAFTHCHDHQPYVAMIWSTLKISL